MGFEPVTGVDQMAMKGNQTISEKELREYEEAHGRGGEGCRL